MAKLIFGCGYLGERVAERWLAAGDDVLVITRSRQRAEKLARAGYAPIVADVTQSDSLADLPECEVVLYAVGYDRTAGVPMHEVFVEGFRRVLHALPTDTGKLVYISSTGVYGQAEGETVDESSPCHPTREGGRACLAAEQLLAAHALGPRSVVLRMAGLYGPGRVPHSAEIRRGEPLTVPADGCLNLIHVDDAASIVVAAAAQAPLPRMYVVSDGHPVERRAYLAEIARLLSAPAPRFAAPAPGSAASQRATASKRVDNTRMQSELSPVLHYPTYRQGLAAILASEQDRQP